MAHRQCSWWSTTTRSRATTANSSMSPMRCMPGRGGSWRRAMDCRDCRCARASRQQGASSRIPWTYCASSSRAKRPCRARMAAAGCGMRDALDRGWRTFGTALSFIAFGVGGLLLRLLVFPPLRLLSRDRETLERRARALIRASFAGHIRIMHRLGVMTYEVRGLERLHRRGLLVLANHPTLVDVVLLVSRLPDAD